MSYQGLSLHTGKSYPRWQDVKMSFAITEEDNQPIAEVNLVSLKPLGQRLLYILILTKIAAP